MRKERFILLFAALLFAFSAVAQSPKAANNNEKVRAFAERFENAKGVEATICAKGSGLGMLKMMLRSQMGGDFIKGVEMIVIIDYSDAPADVAASLRTAFDELAVNFTDGDYKEENTTEMTRYYFTGSADGKIMTGMLALTEDKTSKYVMYFGGRMVGEPQSIIDKK